VGPLADLDDVKKRKILLLPALELLTPLVQPAAIRYPGSHSHCGGPGSSPGHVGFVVNKVELGQVFSFHRLLIISSAAGTIAQLVADVPSGLSHQLSITVRGYNYILKNS
jgi:hypothetical protein